MKILKFTVGGQAIVRALVLQSGEACTSSCINLYPRFEALLRIDSGEIEQSENADLETSDGVSNVENSVDRRWFLRLE